MMIYLVCIDGFKFKFFSIILPKVSAYVKRCDDGTKWIKFLIKDEEILKKK